MTTNLNNIYFCSPPHEFSSAGDNLSLNFIGNVLVVEPGSSIAAPIRSVIQQGCSAVAPTRPVIQPSSSAAAPSRSVAQPSSLAIPPTRSVAQRVGAVIQRVGGMIPPSYPAVGRSPPSFHSSCFIVKKSVLTTKSPY
jgi:hypothetical protein